MKNLSSFRTILTASVLLLLLNAAAQNDSIMRINRKYKTEVGIDMSQIFQKNPGTALILKIKNNRGRFIDLRSAKNYRIQLGINGSIPVSESSTPGDTAFIFYSSKPASTFNVNLMFGKEKVNFYGKFNFYYGFDVGPYYECYNSGYMAYTYPYGGGYSGSTQRESRKAGVAIFPFIGAKYRISEHLSASIESGFVFSYFMSKAVILSVPNITSPDNKTSTLATEKVSGFDFSIKYLRFLTLNYHL